MRRLLTAAAALAVLPLFPASAAAKEIAKVELCGAGGACAAVQGGPQARLAASSSGALAPAPRRAPWYEVRVAMAVEGAPDPPPFSFQWVPSAALVRVMGEADFEWRTVPAGGRQRLERAAAGLAPRPASAMPGPVARKAPPPSPVRDGGGTPWAWVAVVAAALAAAAVGSARHVTRRPASP